jgi:hypothetical protein
MRARLCFFHLPYLVAFICPFVSSENPLFSFPLCTSEGRFESSADAAARGDAKPGKVLLTRTLGTAQTVAGTVTSKAATATYVVGFETV